MLSARIAETFLEKLLRERVVPQI